MTRDEAAIEEFIAAGGTVEVLPAGASHRAEERLRRAAEDAERRGEVYRETFHGSRLSGSSVSEALDNAREAANRLP